MKLRKPKRRDVHTKEDYETAVIVYQLARLAHEEGGVSLSRLAAFIHEHSGNFIGLETLVVDAGSGSKKEDWCSCESKVDAGYRKNGWIVCGRCSKLVGGAPV